MLINLEWGVYYPPRRINLLISIKCDWFRLYNFQRNYKLHIAWLKVRKYIPFIWDPFITTQSYKSYEYLGFTKCANVDKSSISDSCKIIQVHFFLKFCLNDPIIMITPNQTPSVVERRWNGNKTHDLGTSISIWSFERAPHVPNRRPSNTTTKVSDCVSETFHINLWILMPRFPFNFSRIRL